MSAGDVEIRRPEDLGKVGSVHGVIGFDSVGEFVVAKVAARCGLAVSPEGDVLGGIRKIDEHVGFAIRVVPRMTIVAKGG
jgi:hypothetical protein